MIKKQTRKNARSFTIVLPSERNAPVPSWREYGILCIPREHRSRFPGFKEEFLMETDVGSLDVRVSSAPWGTPYGDKKAGQYITGMGVFYRNHPELEPGRELLITKVRRKRYSLDIVVDD